MGRSCHSLQYSLILMQLRYCLNIINVNTYIKSKSDKFELLDS